MASQTLLVLMLLFVMSAAASAEEIQWGLNNQVNAMSVSTGDEVQFSYNAGDHNVVMVSQNDFDDCGTSSVYATYNRGNDTVYFPSQGTFYFICSFPNHCSQYNMKVAISAY